MYFNATSRLNLNMSTCQAEKITNNKCFVRIKNIVMWQDEQHIQPTTATRKNGDTMRKDQN